MRMLSEERKRFEVASRRMRDTALEDDERRGELNRRPRSGVAWTFHLRKERERRRTRLTRGKKEKKTRRLRKREDRGEEQRLRSRRLQEWSDPREERNVAE